MANQSRRPFTIAISGCSSAGKSALAFLLAEIFAEPDTTNKVPIIHGDSFFMPKHLCPLVTYSSAPNDTAFCQMTIEDVRIGEYVISWDGTRANNAFMQYTPPTTNNIPSYAGSIASFESPELDENNRPEVHDRVPSQEPVATTFSVSSTLHEGGRRKVFTVSGPDTDCDEAVNFVRMFEALKSISKDNEIEDVAENLGTMNLEHDTEYGTDSEDGGVPLSSSISEYSEDGGVPLFPKQPEIEDLAPPFPFLSIDIAALHAQHAELISSMRAKIQEFLAEISKEIKHADYRVLPAILQPPHYHPSDNGLDTTPLLTDLQTHLRTLTSISHQLAQSSDISSPLEAQRTLTESKIQSLNLTCKRAMSSLFSAKLWLSTSAAAAKERRFSRQVYMDVKEGGMREPGQMWKTEGYWEQVAWRNYVKEHEWLVGKDGEGEMGGVREGVYVRAQDLGVEDTVRWAVGSVLEELRKFWGVGGEEKGGCGECVGCDGKGCEF
ncbi:hypothetical protein L207DRAFT_577632 [Hyaloscypha variabilis F]|uniref:P-loop containing nucleoside triphosphate hydrolase protein n=1 Tax=Hyaloscypha variabilis (strain UAMH 11265 / GT02V1 / F) TaxID=1149755 RepID=A0A2J6S7Q0_HYAVF|nr:hypothetical protein L207DRAFT_577632 [Hyaloscypha variabilis F]